MSARHTVAVGLAALALAAPSLADYLDLPEDPGQVTYAPFVMPEDFEYSEPLFVVDGYRASYNKENGKFEAWSENAEAYIDLAYYVFPDSSNASRAQALHTLMHSIRDVSRYAQANAQKLETLWRWSFAAAGTMAGLEKDIREITGGNCDDECKCIETAENRANSRAKELVSAEKKEREEADRLEKQTRETAIARVDRDLAGEREDRHAADGNILAVIYGLHGGQTTLDVTNLLADVALSGLYDDLDGKPEASFLIDFVSEGPEDGPTTVTFHQGRLGATNITDFSFTIPKCKWDPSLLNGINARVSSLEETVGDHGTRITALEGRVDNIVSCNCSGSGGGDSGGSGGDCGCSSMNYVTWDELNALDLGSGCDCNLEGIQSQINTLRTELIRLLNYVGYLEHRNGPGR